MTAYLDLALLVFSVVGNSQAATVSQITKGDCSPSVNDVKGNVTINCPGITQKANKRLNLRLREINGLKAKLAAANEWKDRYYDLETRLAAKGENRVLAEQAQKLLKSGDLDAAAQLFDRVIQQQNLEIDDFAENLFNRSQISSLQFKPAEAITFLEQAYRIKPENARYAHEFALVLYHERRWNKCEQVLLDEIDMLRHRPAGEETLEYLAKALNNLGGLQAETFRFDDAERNFVSAQKTYEQLVEFNRDKFLPYLGTTLNNKAAMEARTYRFDDAQRDLTKSISIFESVVTGVDLKSLRESQEKQNIEIEMVGALNNLAFLYSNTKNLAMAETATMRSVEMVKRLVEIDARKYEGNLVASLQNAATVQLAKGKPESAKALSSEALGHAKHLATEDPAAFRVLLARSLILECKLLRAGGSLREAEIACMEGFEIYKDLRQSDSRSYGDEQSMAALLLAELSLGLGRPAEAKQHYEAALALEKDVASKAPSAEEVQFARVLHDSAIYDLANAQFEDARSRLKDAVPLLRSLTAKYPEFVPLLGESLNTLGGLEATAEMWDDAGLFLEEAEKIEEPIAENDLKQYGLTLANIYHNLGTYYFVKGKNIDAEERLRKVVSVYRTLNTTDKTYQQGLLKALFQLSVFYRQLQKWPEAMQTAREAVNLGRGLPPNSFNMILLAEQLSNLGAAEIGANRKDQAEAHLEEALTSYQSAAIDPQYGDLIARSLFVMSSALTDSAIKCGFLTKARDTLMDPAFLVNVRQPLQQCPVTPP